MASQAQRLATNVAGDFYVDSTCIDCGACRWVAPQSFDDSGDYSRVFAQPTDEAQVLRAEMALLACPTGSIGTVAKHDLTTARASFPELLTEDIYYCGYHDEASFGAASYLITRPSGNWLIDVPRWTDGIVKGIARLGGISEIFLTHRDDVGDHAKYAAHFGADRTIHAGDARGALKGLEHVIEGDDPIFQDDEITLIPTPGHTRGSMCLLWRDVALFTGDHLAWSPSRGHLYAFADACWYDWNAQRKSMARLTPYRFQWVLPGHGYPWHGSREAAAESLARCIAWMGSVRDR
ncbi:MAG: MBL fold metallo-hydrolase [bacterium]